MKKHILLALIISSLCVSQAISQIQPQTKIAVKKGWQIVLKDTTFITKYDTVLLLTEEEAAKIKIRENPYEKSTKFYDSLSKKASTKKVTKEIFDLVIKKKVRKEKLVTVIVKSEEVFIPYAGYTIGSIVFKNVDLLEGSVTDTLQKASSKFGIFVNKLHKDTRARIINQNLLFKVGDVVDPYMLADNERILRQFKTLRDARIYLKESEKYSNVVDVVIVTQDVSSIGVAGGYSSLRKYRFEVYDINILGYARQLRVSYFKNSAGIPKNGYEVTLREPNLLSTFIQGELQYTDNYIRQRTRFALGRDFLTPEIKYAGGIELYKTNEKFYFEEYDTLEIPYTENNTDLWMGRSIEFKKRRNIIFSTRLNTRNFIDKPFVSSDSNSFFYNRSLMLGSITLIKRNFLKTLRIRGFGKTEDVPVGGSLSVVFGKEFTEFKDRPYVELDATFGKYFSNIGYLNLSLAAGSFFKDESAEDGLVAMTSTYFSDLLKLRKTQVRQFVYFTYTKGFNRVLDRTISLNGKWENKDALPPLGNKRVTLGFETVYFMPWYTYGFQFALFHRIDFNLLSNDALLFDKASLFPTLRIGARMLNENLVLPRISVELAYYAKNKNYNSAWEFKFSTTLVNLFGTSQVFKPQVSRFN